MSSSQGDWKPLGRTGFLLRPEPTSGEAAFLAVIALYAPLAAELHGVADVRRAVLSIIDRYQLGHLRERALDTVREALPEPARDRWDDSMERVRPQRA